MSKFFLGKSVGFIGAGNMTQAILSAFFDAGILKSDQVWVSNRTPGKLKKLSEKWSVHTTKNNEEVVDQCDYIILAVKPQDLDTAIENISSSFGEHQVLISLAAGISLAKLKKLAPNAGRFVRVMTNTAARVRRATVGYCTSDSSEATSSLIEDLFSCLGYVVPIEEGEQFEAFTVASSSGIGFVFELMQYWQEWLEERGIEPQVAKAITVETFLGASLLAEARDDITLSELQNQVTSKKGVTFAGLNSMRELEVERTLRYSFEKAALRDRELGQ